MDLDASGAMFCGPSLNRDVPISRLWQSTIWDLWKQMRIFCALTVCMDAFLQRSQPPTTPLMWAVARLMSQPFAILPNFLGVEWMLFWNAQAFSHIGTRPQYIWKTVPIVFWFQPRQRARTIQSFMV